jgi:hypothetical protein
MNRDRRDRSGRGLRLVTPSVSLLGEEALERLAEINRINFGIFGSSRLASTVALDTLPPTESLTNEPSSQRLDVIKMLSAVIMSTSDLVIYSLLLFTTVKQ